MLCFLLFLHFLLSTVFIHSRGKQVLFVPWHNKWPVGRITHLLFHWRREYPLLVIMRGFQPGWGGSWAKSEQVLFVAAMDVLVQRLIQMSDSFVWDRWLIVLDSVPTGGELEHVRIGEMLERGLSLEKCVWIDVGDFILLGWWFL